VSQVNPVSPVSQFLHIVGARPARGAGQTLIHTGQHFDDKLSEIFFRELDIPAPDHNLEVHGGGHGDMTGRMLQALEPLTMRIAPACVVLYGDTNSTLAGALCASKLGIPVAHVEAGLRSFDRRMPEEINRCVTDHLSDLLLCPTRTAVENLAAEGIVRGVHPVGDVMYDVALDAARRAQTQSAILGTLALEPKRYAVATIHRAENTDDTAALGAAIGWLAQRAAEQPLVMPIHPRTRMALGRTGIPTGSIRLIDPLGYIDMTQLVCNAAAVFTDSGGLQKEAYFHRVPCVTLRSSSEWTETIDAGWNRLWTVPAYREPRREIADYGTGDAADRIAGILFERYAAAARQSHSPVSSA
jgi:UDP-GlcNAc3NAcA epimerase